MYMWNLRMTTSIINEDLTLLLIMMMMMMMMMMMRLLSVADQDFALRLSFVSSAHVTV